MIIEVGTAITPTGILENVVIKARGRGSLYAETAVIPGFADAHAHPQVIDYGGGRWRNAYEWIEFRKLSVDEASLRADVELSGRLAKLALWRALLEGTTLMAMVGSYHANLNAVVGTKDRPRVVLMPTILERGRGWWSLGDLLLRAENLFSLDGYVKPGLFLHSIRLVRPETLRKAYRIAENLGLPLALHLSEGVPELEVLVKILGLRRGSNSRVVAVHCQEDEDYKAYGISVVHCPLSNLLLYGRTLRRIEQVDALGSDWPLLLGSVYGAYRTAVAYHGRVWSSRLFRAATVGGYEVYGVNWRGDATLFDERAEKVLRGDASRPLFVLVKGTLAVQEGRLRSEDLSHREVMSAICAAVREAREKYPARQ